MPRTMSKEELFDATRRRGGATRFSRPKIVATSAGFEPNPMKTLLEAACTDKRKPWCEDWAPLSPGRVRKRSRAGLAETGSRRRRGLESLWRRAALRPG